MKISSIEKEKNKTQKFAEANDISEDEINATYQKIFDELPEDMEEGKKTVRALRKTRGILNRKIQSGNYQDGFILFRFRNQDYNLFAWNQVDKFIKENGMEKALELKKVDEDGNYLHTSGFNIGEKIDKEAIFGSAIGILKDEDDNLVPKWISIGQYNIKDTIPLCQEISINIKKGNKPGPLFPSENLVYLNGVRLVGGKKIYEQDEIQDYENIIKNLFGDIIFDDYDELKEYCSEHLDNKNNFAGIDAICMNISPQSDVTSNVPVDFEIGDTLVTLWIRPEIFEGLSMQESCSGILLVSGYESKDDDGNPDVGFNVGGFIPYDDI